MPRPRVLDEGKQREVCALLTAGMTMGEAAAYVGCCEKTIRREQRRDEDFDERVRRARMAARLGPLQAVREAAATHWRAAAWLVDRQDRQEERERRARREQAERKRQRAQAKRRPRQPWDLEQEIQQIASARPPAAKKATRAHHDSPQSPRRRPGEQVHAAPPPTNPATAKPPAPVAAALNQLATQLAASANVESARRTKPVERPAEQPAAEPTKQGANGHGGDPGGEGFVPSLRLFGQNEEGVEDRAAGRIRGAGPEARADGGRH